MIDELLIWVHPDADAQSGQEFLSDWEQTIRDIAKNDIMLVRTGLLTTSLNQRKNKVYEPDENMIDYLDTLIEIEKIAVDLLGHKYIPWDARFVMGRYSDQRVFLSRGAKARFKNSTNEPVVFHNVTSFGLFPNQCVEYQADCCSLEHYITLNSENAGFSLLRSSNK